MPTRAAQAIAEGLSMAFQRGAKLRTWQIAERWGVSERRVQQIIKSGALDPVGRTPGGYALVTIEAIEAYEIEQTEKREKCEADTVPRGTNREKREAFDVDCAKSAKQEPAKAIAFSANDRR